MVSKTQLYLNLIWWNNFDHAKYKYITTLKPSVISGIFIGSSPFLVMKSIIAGSTVSIYAFKLADIGWSVFLKQLIMHSKKLYIIFIIKYNFIFKKLHTYPTV